MLFGFSEQADFFWKTEIKARLPCVCLCQMPLCLQILLLQKFGLYGSIFSTHVRCNCQSVMRECAHLTVPPFQEEFHPDFDLRPYVRRVCFSGLLLADTHVSVVAVAVPRCLCSARCKRTLVSRSATSEYD